MSAPASDERGVEAELVSILSDLVALRSDYPPGDTHAICDYLVSRLSRAGYAATKHVDVEPYANVVARVGSGSPRIVLNAHIDTVGVDEPGAWATDPLRAEVREGSVHGLGAANCKGSAAAQVWVAEAIARAGGGAGELVFTFVADEEAMGPNGMGSLRAAGLVDPEILVYGAPTDNELIVAERGAMWVEITTFGRTAHAGDPDAGDNAIERMMRLLEVLRRQLFDRLGDRRDGEMVSTANIGRIDGGHNTNAVPSRCTVEIDRRLLPRETVSDALDEMRAALALAGEPPGSYQAELMLGSDGFRASDDSRVVEAFREAIAARTGREARTCNAMGVSDARHFAGDGVELVGFGPGAGSAGHAANECVPTAQLVDAALVYRDVVDRLRSP